MDPKDKDSVVPVNLVAIRVIHWSKDENGDEIVWIDEDLKDISTNTWEKNSKNNKDKQNKWEKLIYFYTSLPVNNTDDAVYVLFVYLMRWYVETYIRYLKQIFELEKVCIIDFYKIKNLCRLLPIASNFLYEKYADFENIESEKTTRTLKSIFEKQNNNDWEREVYKRRESVILNELLYFTYQHFIKVKWFTCNPDSYARFIKDIMGNTIKYTEAIIRYDIYDP